MIHRFGHHWRFGHPWIYGHPWGYEQVWWPGMLLSALNMVFLVALFIGLSWALLRWIIPYIKPIIADIFGMPPVDSPALEILRQRYAAGEIDAVTFEQMRERLEASYRRGSNGPLLMTTATRVRPGMATKRPFPRLAYAGREAPGWQSKNDIRLKLKDEVS